MKKSLSILLVVIFIFSAFMLTACGNSTAKPKTAEEVVSKLKDSNLPIGNIVVSTEENDKNKLLGRPNQYLSKVNFADTRIRQIEGSDLKGGCVETFNNIQDVKTRKDYLESVYKAMPIYTEYILVNGPYLLRLSKDLTTAQVYEYKEAFDKIQ